MNTKNIIIVISLILVGVFATLFFTRGTIVNTYPVIEKIVGATPGTEFSAPEYCFNGLCHRTFSVSLRTGTTTPVIQTGPSATSTATFQCRLDTASSTATVWTLAKTTAGIFATTTPIAPNTSVGANGKGLLTSSSTPFAPNEVFVLGARGGDSNGDTTPVGFVPAGTCFGEWVYSR